MPVVIEMPYNGNKIHIIGKNVYAYYMNDDGDIEEKKFNSLAKAKRFLNNF